MEYGNDVDMRPLVLTQEQAEPVKRAFAKKTTEEDLENLEYLAVECLDESGCGLDADTPWQAIGRQVPVGCPHICGAYCFADPTMRW